MADDREQAPAVVGVERLAVQMVVGLELARGLQRGDDVAAQACQAVEERTSRADRSAAEHRRYRRYPSVKQAIGRAGARSAGLRAADPRRRAARDYESSWSTVHSRGSLSSRQRWTFAPWRIRPALVWSNVISTTSSGRSATHCRSRPAVQREGSALPRSPVS